MTNTTLSNREFTRNFSEAVQAAAKGPVFITERGDTAYVLLKFADYQRLLREHRTMAELLSVPELAAKADFEPLRSTETSRAADFS